MVNEINLLKRIVERLDYLLNNDGGLYSINGAAYDIVEQSANDLEALAARLELASNETAT